MTSLHSFTFNRDQALVEAVHAGANGYLLKSCEPEFLLAAIRTVHSGYFGFRVRAPDVRLTPPGMFG